MIVMLETFPELLAKLMISRNCADCERRLGWSFRINSSS